MVTLLREKEQPEFPENEPDDDMYDETPEAGVNGLYGLELNDGLTEAEMLIAPRYALLCRGVMIVHGQPGCGKGVFGAYMAWKLRRMFAQKKALLDYKPRKLFDYGYEQNRYVLFNAEFMMREVNKMAVKAGGKKYTDPDANLDKDDKIKIDSIARDWRKTHEVLLMHGIQELDELKRYLHNRNPNNPMGKMISNIVSVWRHLDLLVLGMCPNIQEIDVKGFLQYVTHEVRPEWCVSRKNTTLCRIRRKSHVGNGGVIKFETKPYPLFVDGGKPRPEIGVQVNNYNVTMGEPEKRIVDFLRSKGGFANLNEISEAIGEELNECDERLKFMHGLFRYGGDVLEKAKAPIQCKCLYDVYNSQDFKNLQPKMGKTEE